MDEKDKEIEYLEDKIKELEKTIQKLAKDKKKEMFGRYHPDIDTITRRISRRTFCSMCGTSHNVELMDGLDVYLCSNCSNNWN